MTCARCFGDMPTVNDPGRGPITFCTLCLRALLALCGAHPAARFAVLWGQGAPQLERALNVWVSQQGAGLKLKRTQLAVGSSDPALPPAARALLYALVNYETP